MGRPVYRLSVCNANCELIVHNQRAGRTITKKIAYSSKAPLTKDLSRYLLKVATMASFSFLPCRVPREFIHGIFVQMRAMAEL
jgi:hypothetical protein